MVLNNIRLYFIISVFSVCSFCFAQESTFKDTIIAGQHIKLNLETGAIKFISNQNKTEAANQEPKSGIKDVTKNSDTNFHIVSKDESFIDIAYRYKLSALELKTLNNLDSYAIEPGQKLRVKKDSVSDMAKQNQSINTDSIHIVKKEETLFSIAEDYDLELKVLKKQNNLSDNTIEIGQKLIIKSQTSSIKAGEKKHLETWKVKEGETLYSIAIKNSISVQELKAFNNLTSNTIKIGQILQLKK